MYSFILFCIIHFIIIAGEIIKGNSELNKLKKFFFFFLFFLFNLFHSILRTWGISAWPVIIYIYRGFKYSSSWFDKETILLSRTENHVTFSFPNWAFILHVSMIFIADTTSANENLVRSSSCCSSSRKSTLTVTCINWLYNLFRMDQRLNYTIILKMLSFIVE